MGSWFKAVNGKLEPPFLSSYSLILSSFYIEAYSWFVTAILSFVLKEIYLNVLFFFTCIVCTCSVSFFFFIVLFSVAPIKSRQDSSSLLEGTVGINLATNVRVKQEVWKSTLAGWLLLNPFISSLQRNFFSYFAYCPTVKELHVWIQ